MINKKILVTGSRGFIGSHLLDELLPKNKIIGLNISSDKKNKKLFSNKKEYFKINYQ